MGNQRKKDIYSYHTFQYAFLWDNKGKVTLDKFYKQFCPEKNDSDTVGWHEDNIISKQKLTPVKELVNHQTNLHEEYRAFQYFNEATRKALFRADENIVRNYVLRLEKPDPNMEYIYRLKCCTRSPVLSKDTQVTEDIIDQYDLIINAIRLKVFNTGVAILIFELMYPLPESGKEQARKDILTINEYGRRLFPEFITDKREKFLCADSIEILCAGSNRSIAKDDFWKYFSTSDENNEVHYVKNPIYLPEIIRKLLQYENRDFTVTSDYEKADNKSTFYIQPALDDRMFVCCCVIDADYTNSFIDNTNYGRQNPEWKFMTNYDTARELYAVTNIDGDTDSSCQNRMMLNQYFEKQLYLRWIEYGTIHAVTNHSMVCLTGDLTYIDSDTDIEKETGVLYTVVYPFLTLYTQMCTLVLAQRASLISFDAKITNAVAAMKQDTEEADKDRLNEVLKLSQEFAVFQGEILLAEITSQIQGIEIYEKLQTMLFVDKLEKNIQNQLNNLFEIAESIQARIQRRYDDALKEQQEQQERREKKFDLALTKFGAVFTAISIISIFSGFADFHQFFGISDNPEYKVLTIIVVCTVAAGSIIAIWKLIKKWIGNDK